MTGRGFRRPATAPNSPRHCERSEAIQEATKKDLDCFVARAPRNDGVRFPLISLRAQRPSCSLSRHCTSLALQQCVELQLARFLTPLSEFGTPMELGAIMLAPELGST